MRGELDLFESKMHIPGFGVTRLCYTLGHLQGVVFAVLYVEGAATIMIANDLAPLIDTKSLAFHINEIGTGARYSVVLYAFDDAAKSKKLRD